MRHSRLLHVQCRHCLPGLGKQKRIDMLMDLDCSRDLQHITKVILIYKQGRARKFDYPMLEKWAWTKKESRNTQILFGNV